MYGDPVRYSEEEEWDEEIPAPVYPDVLTVDWTPPEVIATFYDLKGEALIEVEAPRNPCGFSL